MPSTDPTDRALRTNSTYNFKILSLDGGGLRAAFTAAFLDGLESILRETGQLEPNESIASYFDLIAGTSTGGIIATALAMGRDAASILAFYQQYGPKVFDRQPRSKLRKTLEFLPDRVLGLFGQDTDSILRAKYASMPLDQAITELLGSRTMADAKFRLIVPASRLTVGRPIVFRTAHLPGQIRDKQISAKDVVMATTATPMFFPPHRIENPAQPDNMSTVDFGQTILAYWPSAMRCEFRNSAALKNPNSPYQDLGSMISNCSRLETDNPPPRPRCRPRKPA